MYQRINLRVVCVCTKDKLYGSVVLMLTGVLFFESDRLVLQFKSNGVGLGFVTGTLFIGVYMCSGKSKLLRSDFVRRFVNVRSSVYVCINL